MCRDHDAVHHACGHIDFAYHWRLPDVGLVQFGPCPKLGGNDFLASPESLVVGFFQLVAGSFLLSHIAAARGGCFLNFGRWNFSVARHGGSAAAQNDRDKTNIDQFVKTSHSAFLLMSSHANALIVSI